MGEIDRHLPAVTEELDALDDEDWFFLVTAKGPEGDDTDWRTMGYTGDADRMTAHINLAGSHLEFVNEVTENAVGMDRLAQFVLEAALLHLRQRQMWQPPDEDG